MPNALLTLELRHADINTRFREIADMDTADVTEELETEVRNLRREQTANETQQGALKLAELPATPIETHTGEGREFRSLVQRSNVGEIVHCAIFGGNPTGATAEMQKHYGVEVRSVPLAMLINRLPDDAEIEMRQSQAPSDVGATQDSIIPYVFPQSAGVWLGIDMPTVGVGEHVFPIITTAPGNITTPAEGVDATESNATYEAEVLTGKRYQTFITYSREDRAKFAQMDESLRENLSGGMSIELDKQMLTGTDGLLTGTILADNDSGSAQTTYAQYRHRLLFARVDGQYSSQVGEIKILMGSDTYAHAAAQYRGSNDNMDALMSLISQSGGVRVSAHVPDTAATKQNALVRLGMRRDYVQPVWGSVELIVDELTMADAGKIKISAVGLFNQKLLRSEGFHKQSVKVS